MKRFICVMLCTLMIVSCCFIPSFAAEKKNSNPTILISGFLCSQLYLNYGTDEEVSVWNAALKRASEYICDDFFDVAGSLAGLAIGKTSEFGNALGDGAEYVLDLFRCNPDGSSAYELSHYPNDPATSNLKYMYENGLEDRLYEKNFCRYLSKQTDPSRVYCFQYDSRMDAVTVANQLRDFINEVKEYNNAEKVNIFALSFGGLITSTYLTLFEKDNSVERVVMSVLAIGGTNIPDRLFRGKISLLVEALIKFAETILAGESNFARFFENDETDKLNSVISGASDGLRDSLKCWGSIWSLCSTDLYENLKKDYLDPAENSQIIKNNDFLHYEIKPKFTEVYNRIIENGGAVSILCATGSEIIAGGELNGDVILPAEKVSGATCAPVGKRFADGYTGTGASCDNPDHNHVSPSMEIDASTAYLPENTWFIENQYHGQYYYEEYTRSLVTKLLFTDEIKDVYSDKNYPQYEYSNHAYRSIHAKFNSSPTGYLCDKDSALIIKNLSAENHIKILAVTSYGAELDFDVSEIGMLEPGEEVSIAFDGDIPDVGATAAQITVSFIEFGCMNPMNTEDFAVMIDNGNAPGCSGDFVPAQFKSNLENAVPEFLYKIIVNLSLRQSIECIYNAVKQLV